MAELLHKLQQLQTLPPDVHWFCVVGTAQDEEAPEPLTHIEHPLAADAQLRSDLAADTLIIYSYGDAVEYQDRLTTFIDQQLSRCDLCVEEYYKARKRLDERLRNDFEDEQVDAVAKTIDERDFQRINRALDDATRVLQNLEPSKRHKNSLGTRAHLALFEVLCNDAYVLDQTLLEGHFQTPFKLVQTKKRLTIVRYTPAATAFLFDPDPTRCQWATDTWLRYRKTPTKAEFEYAIKGPLVRHLQSISQFGYVPDQATLQRTWTGIGLIINMLDNDLVTHSLRALDVDVFKLALDHLRFDSPSFRTLVETIQKLLEVAPKDFWDAMGTISPTTIVEQIFANKQFDRCLEDSIPSHIDEASPLRDILSWIKPFMRSFDTANQAGVCRTLSDQLLKRLQADRFPEHARMECYRAGLSALAWTLTNLNHDTSYSSTGRIIAKDVLDVVGDFMEEIASIPYLPLGLLKASCSEISLRIVKLALALECKSVRTDQESIKQMNGPQDLPAGWGTYTTPVWEGITRNLDAGNIDLAKAALVGINDLTGYDKFKVNAGELHSKEKSAYNMKHGRLTHLVCQILERLNDFSPPHLDQLYRSPDSATALVSSLLSADSNLFEAGVNLVKSLSAELARREAIGHLLKTFTETTLNAFSWATHRIARNKTYAPCQRMLKTSSDMVDVLCNSHDGLLRTVNFNEGQRKAVHIFWQYQWEGLTMIYDMTERWGYNKVEDHAALKEFCRDTMQASERLFDQYSVFANALRSSPQTIKVEDGDNIPVDIDTELLRYPATTMVPMVKWLRLRDVFLVEIAVKLTNKVLAKLTELNRTIEEGTSKMLEQIIISGPQGRSHLSEQEKAELARALEANTGRPVIPPLDESETTSDQTRASTPHLATQKKRVKNVPIDLDAWKAKAKSGSTRATGQVVEISDDEDYGAHGLEKQMEFITASTEKVQEMKVQQVAARASNKKLLPTHKKPEKPEIGKLQHNFPLQPQRGLLNEAQQASFREKRKQEQEIAKRKREKELAIIRRKAGVGGQVSGQGSALNGIGVTGKDHAPQGPSMMLSSESEAESEDDDDEDILGVSKPKVSNAVKQYEADKAQVQRGPVKKTKHVRSQKDMRARLAPDLKYLHKEILSWDFFHTGDFPPSSNRADYRLVTSSFKTPYDYKNTFLPLLMLEAWQSFLKSKEESNFKVFETRVASRMTTDAFLEVSTTMTPNEAKEMAIGEADIILLSKGNSPATDEHEPHCFARVWRITRKKTVVEVIYRANIGNGLVDSMSPNVTLYGAKTQSIIPLEREYGALSALEYYDLCDEITRAQPSPLLQYSEKQLTPLMGNYKINQAQAKAVRSAVDNDAFTLVQGPPGSGKTKTIVAIVGALLTNSLSAPAQPIVRPQAVNMPPQRSEAAAKKLLVCAPSNAAVDELVMRLKQGVKTMQGEDKTLSVVRLGRSDAINANVMDVTLEELVNAKVNIANDMKPRAENDIGALMAAHKATCEEFNSLRSNVDALKASGKAVSPEHSRDFEVMKRKKEQLSRQIDAARDSGDMYARNAEINRRKVQQEILDGAHVICATLSGSGHEMFQNLNIEFETVIIDEAAQSIELSALIPLKYGCSKCILVGDPKQLPPTVLSREAARFQFEQSLFVRMQENHPKDVHLLDTQYRMHPEISQFPSQAFYDGRLVDGPHMARQRARPWHESSILGPYRFFDVQGFHQSATRGHSLVNLAEIDIALKLYDRLTKDCRGYDFRGKIGIITPYKSQLRELRSRFSRLYGDEILTSVEFNTTDAFQGRESEVIIFSCVRASLTKGIGFLSDIRRMNVGITRAKSSLWLLGNGNSLMQGEFWVRLIQDAKQRNVYTTGDLKAILGKPLLNIRAEPAAPQPGPVPAAQTRRESTDIEMLDAPSFGNLPTSRPGSPHFDHSDSILNGPRSDQASGGGNGLNTNLNCRTCGSFKHQTHHCDNLQALETVGKSCHRCREMGHSRPFCKAERCLTCGEIGHVREKCTSAKMLSSREKQVVARQELEYKKSKLQLPEQQRRFQLGDHDGMPPVVQPTADPMVVGQERKRKFTGSPPPGASPGAPKGPKSANENAGSAPTELGRKPSAANGSADPRRSSASMAIPMDPRKNSASASGQHGSVGPPQRPVCGMANGIPTGPKATTANGGRRDQKENANLSRSSPASIPDKPPAPNLRGVDGPLAGLPPRPTLPGLANVKAPRPKKKNVDVFLRPNKKR